MLSLLLLIGVFVALWTCYEMWKPVQLVYPMLLTMMGFGLCLIIHPAVAYFFMAIMILVVRFYLVPHILREREELKLSLWNKIQNRSQTVLLERRLQEMGERHETDR